MAVKKRNKLMQLKCNCSQADSAHLAPVVQTVDDAIHRINHYPLDIAIGFAITYPVDSDLPSGWRYPAFEQLKPGYHYLPTPNWLPFCITKTITTDLKGPLIPYWKACFVPSVELKCKFPLHFGPVVAGAWEMIAKHRQIVVAAHVRENVYNYDLWPSHALFPWQLKRSLEETKRLEFFKNAYRNVRKAYFDWRTTQSDFCFGTNILCNRR